MFPVINNINDIKPLVENHPSFVILEREDYTIIDYVFAFGDTFPSEQDHPDWMKFRECRGIAFDLEGNVLSRPLHKFFNLTEKPLEDAKINWAEASIYEKLDGSMIRPLFINGSFRLATRKGIGDVSMQAEAFLERSRLKQRYFELFRLCYLANQTPIFEWCSRENRVVIDHPEDKLVLLAIRNNTTGKYDSRFELESWAGLYAIPVVEEHKFNHEEKDQYLETLRTAKDTEGIVVNINDSHFVKIKAEDYCQLHRTKSYFDSEHQVIKCIIDNTIDDLYPLLTVPQKVRLEKYLSDFHSGLYSSALELEKYIIESMAYIHDNKAYACEFVKNKPKQWHPILFEAKKLTDYSVASLVNWLMKNYIQHYNAKKVDECRWLFNATWV